MNVVFNIVLLNKNEKKAILKNESKQAQKHKPCTSGIC